MFKSYVRPRKSRNNVTGTFLEGPGIHRSMQMMLDLIRCNSMICAKARLNSFLNEYQTSSLKRKLTKYIFDNSNFLDSVGGRY